jgi:deoxyribonuclease V
MSDIASRLNRAIIGRNRLLFIADPFHAHCEAVATIRNVDCQLGDRGVTTLSDELRTQEALRRQVDLTPAFAGLPATAVGLDVSYARDSDRMTAAAVVVDVATGATVEAAVVHGTVDFPYVPGLLGFREVPILMRALDRLRAPGEVLVCDGYGIAHPRRIGLASHLGVVTGRPAFGVAKTPFTGDWVSPGAARGEWSALTVGGEVLGRVLRTQPGVKPVFVSVGHRIGLDQATALTPALAVRCRLPETTRRADHLSRQALDAT